MRVDRGVAPLAAKFLKLITIDVDNHRVAANTRVCDLFGLTSKAALGHLLDVLFGDHDRDRLAPGAAALGEAAHRTATERRISRIIGQWGPLRGVVGVMDRHISHRAG